MNQELSTTPSINETFLRFVIPVIWVIAVGRLLADHGTGTFDVTPVASGAERVIPSAGIRFGYGVGTAARAVFALGTGTPGSAANTYKLTTGAKRRFEFEGANYDEAARVGRSISSRFQGSRLSRPSEFISESIVWRLDTVTLIGAQAHPPRAKLTSQIHTFYY